MMSAADKAAAGIQAAVGGGAVALSMADVDFLLKVSGILVTIAAFGGAQWWAWRRDVRERREHKAEMERHRVFMRQHVDALKTPERTDETEWPGH